MSLGRKITENDIGKLFKTRSGNIVEVKEIELGRCNHPVKVFDKTEGEEYFYAEKGEFYIGDFDDGVELSIYDIVECLSEEDTAPEPPETVLEEASVQKLTLTIPAGTSRLEGEFEGYRVTLEKL